MFHYHRGQQEHAQHSRPEPVVVRPRLAPPNHVRTPVVGKERINHDGKRNECEQARRNAADAVAKIEETNGEAAHDDGELQPGEESALVGEEDLGLDADGEGDTPAVGGLQERLAGHDLLNRRGRKGGEMVLAGRSEQGTCGRWRKIIGCECHVYDVATRMLLPPLATT
ncbi:hypothetical protein BC938DRAFT_475284 [Jimgerdemannia flammicorona]|uniref:Uncharacterized protein n=1 Tax=Jimgerdemannia flammicorona TaxID=994334 RepID=A0A433QRT1_9FUNG|nr:hypothetical protein BC938DRAFT_475284 [Jimgerdemannia flammicorona]